MGIIHELFMNTIVMNQKFMNNSWITVHEVTFMNYSWIIIHELFINFGSWIIHEL